MDDLLKAPATEVFSDSSDEGNALRCGVYIDGVLIWKLFDGMMPHPHALIIHHHPFLPVLIEKYGADEPDELYDEDADAADEKWVDKHFRKSMEIEISLMMGSVSTHLFHLSAPHTGKQATGGGKRQGPESDAVLNCPCCFSTLCMDCQR